MAGMVSGEIVGARKLVLGFDAGCFTCSDLAGRIKERVGDKHSVENLNDPQLLAWREEALGKNAKWVPTLFEIDGEKVLRAWAGWRMGWALSRSIGPAATWQVMQALGEVGAAPRIEDPRIVNRLPSKTVEIATGVSRGQFLKGLGGVAVAMSMFSGTSPLADKAMAADNNPYAVVRTRKILGVQARNIAQRRAASRDVKNVAGIALATAAKVAAAKPEVYIHTTRNGTVANVVVYYLGSSRRTLCHYSFSKPIPIDRGSKSIAKLWIPDGNKQVLVKVSEAGRLWERPAGMSVQSGVTPLRDCPPVGGGGTGITPTNCAKYRSYECLSWEYDLKCVANDTAGVSLTCAGCIGSLIFTTGTASLTGALILAACGPYGCAGQLSSAGEGCARCRKAQWVTRYNYSRC